MTSKTATENNKKCSTCQRLGSFYPVRIAIAIDSDQDSNYFHIDEIFLDELPKLPVGLRYVYRRLNEGFIYTYAKQWKGYAREGQYLNAYNVNENGYITAIDKDSIVVQPKAKDYVCFQNPQTSRGADSARALLLDLFPEKDVSTDVDIFYSKHQLSLDSLNLLETNDEIRKKLFTTINVDSPTKNQLEHFNNFFVVEDAAEEKVSQIKHLIPWEPELIKDISKYKFSPPSVYRDETNEATFVFQALKKDKDGNFIKDPITNEPQFDENAPEEPYTTTSFRMIVLNDPIGILEDTLSIINYLAEKIRTPDEERLYQSALQIIKLKSLVKAKIHSEKYSELWELNAFRYGAENMMDGVPEKHKENIRIPLFPTEEQAEKALESLEVMHDNMMLKRQHYMENFFDFEEKDIVKLTKEVNAEFNEQWNQKSLFGMVDSFSDKLKQKAMDDWLEQHAQKILNYGKTKIEPIIEFYIEWLKSDILLSYMEHGFDHKSPFSASNFITINSRIIGNADTLELCSKYFAELLQEANYNNRKNYLLRAFTFDSKTLQDHVNSVNDFLGKNQVTTLSFAGTQFFDESSIEQHKNYQNQVATIKESIKIKIDIFSEQIGGTVARVFHGKANQSPNAAKTVAMKSFEVFSGKTLTTKAYSGKLTDIIQQIMRDSPIDFDEAQSRQAKKNAKNAFKVNLKKALLENFNTDVDFHRLGKMRTKVYMVLHLDTQQLAKINPNMTKTQIGEAMQGAIRSSGQVISDSKVAGALEESTQLGQLERQSQKVFARQGTGFGFGVFAFSLQTLALIGATQGVATGANLQTGTNFIGVIAATFGNVADVLDRQLQMKMIEVGKTAKLSYLKGWTKRISLGGLYGGAILLSAVEVFKAYDAFKKDQYIIMTLYGVNAFVVFFTTHAFMRSGAMLLGLRAGYWGLILIGVSVVISYGIDLLEKREIRNFLEASAWGKQSKNWSQTVEKTEFEKIYE